MLDAIALLNEPVWTMPGLEAGIGRLTSQFHHLVDNARLSITSATYNFEATSEMWQTLQAASERDGVRVTVYVDAAKGDPIGVKSSCPRLLSIALRPHPVWPSRT